MDITEGSPKEEPEMTRDEPFEGKKKAYDDYDDDDEDEDGAFELPPPGKPPVEPIRLKRRNASSELEKGGDDDDEDDDEDDEDEEEEKKDASKKHLSQDPILAEFDKKICKTEEDREQQSSAWRRSLGNVTAEDLLNEENFHMPPFCHNFSYAVVSFIPRNTFKTISMEKMRFGFMVKIAGLFDTHEAAMERVKHLCEKDNVFSRFVIPTNKWVLLEESLAASTADPNFEFPEDMIHQVMDSYVHKAYKQADKIQKRIRDAYYFVPDDETLQDLERYPTNKPRPDRGVETMKTFQRAQDKAHQMEEHDKLMQDTNVKHVSFDYFESKPEDKGTKAFNGEQEEEGEDNGDDGEGQNEPLVIDLKGRDDDIDKIPLMKQQQFVLFSAFDNQSVGKGLAGSFKGIMINVRGGFKHREDAEMCAKDIVNIERITDYTTVSVGNWSVVGDDTADELDYASPDARGFMDSIREHFHKHENSFEHNVRRGLEINVPDQAKILNSSNRERLGFV